MTQEEVVLGVDRSLISEYLKSEQGFHCEQIEQFYELLRTNLKPLLRSIAEMDLSFKQVIPYAILHAQGEFLVYERTVKQGESRLHNRLSLGVGGHINPIDENGSDPIFSTLMREMAEEVFINIVNGPKLIGFINDDNSEVGKVHLGVAFIIEVEKKTFKIVETDKMVHYWMDAEQLSENIDRFETWSQLANTYLLLHEVSSS